MTALDHIITNSLLQATIDTGIIKLDTSNQFPIVFIAGTEKRMPLEGKMQFTKHLINNKSKEKFKNALQEMILDQRRI